MKLLNWNIGSLNSLFFSKSERAIQSRSVLKKISQQNYDVISFQEIKISPAGPTNKEIACLNKYFSDYHMVWRSSQKPAKLKYSGVLFLYSPKLKPLKIIKPKIDDQNLDNEGRLLVLEFEKYYLVNSYVPHYEFHKEKQYDHWMKELTEYLVMLSTDKPLLLTGDLVILPIIGQSFTRNKRAVQKFEDQYSNLIKLGLIDAYAVKPNNANSATWWASNIPKQIDQGIRLDY